MTVIYDANNIITYTKTYFGWNGVMTSVRGILRTTQNLKGP